MLGIENFEIAPDEVRTMLQNKKEEIEEALNNVKERIARAPFGTLRIVRRGQSLQYYHRTESSDTKGKYLRKSQTEIARELAQKDYDQKLIIELEKQLKVIKNCLKKYHPDEIERVYSDLHPFRKTLVNSVFLPREEYRNKWENVNYERKSFSEDSLGYYTDAGERVRSKSEIIIANKLLKMGVPYRYEYPIYFNSGIKVHPDFYCLNIRTRKEYAWEHFGMMDNEEYADKAIWKIEEYEKNGYWPGKNLITTFETFRKPMNANALEQIIKQYLI